MLKGTKQSSRACTRSVFKIYLSLILYLENQYILRCDNQKPNHNTDAKANFPWFVVRREFREQ